MKICKDCNNLKKYEEFYKNKNSKDGRIARCKICYRKKKYQQTWTKKNNYYKTRYDSDITFKLRVNLRNRLGKCIKIKSWNKSNTFHKYIGCTLEELKAHIESKFTEGMTWENYGQWELDHISPLSLAVNELELYNLCHFSNLQPLWKCDNIKKSNRI
jgi:hypothetical protein